MNVATVLMILKIIGIVLLVLLGIVLILLLAVLFVPIRYRVDASLHDETVREKFDTKVLLENLTAGASISWLFHLVNGRIEYPKDPEFTLRILCFKVFRTHIFDKTEEAENTEKEKENSQKNAGAIPDKKQNDKTEPAEEVPLHKESKNTTKAENAADDIAAQKETECASPENRNEGTRSPLSDDEESLEKDKADYLKKTEEQKKEGQPKDKSGTAADLSDPASQQEQNTSSETKGQQAQGRLAGLKEKIRAMAQKAADKTKAICKKAQDAGKNISYYLNILDSDLFAAALNKVSRQTKRILRQLLPRQWTLAGEVGTGDPGTDGKLLEIQGILYPWTGGHLYVQPNFDGCMVYLDLHAKGKITVFVLLLAAVSCFFDKKIRRVIRLFRKETSGKKAGKKSGKKANQKRKTAA